MTRWPVIIIGGLASALFCGLATTGSPGGLVLAYFCQLPLFLIGLSMGAAASTIAGAFAAVAMAVLGGLIGALTFVVLNVVPVALLVRQALLSRQDESGKAVWYPPGLLVGAATMLAAAIYTAAMLFLALQPEGLTESLRTFVGGFADQILAPGQAEQREQLIDLIAPLLPGSVAASWLLMIFVNAGLAQRLLVKLGRGLRPSPDYGESELPRWLLPATAAAAAVGLLLPEPFGLFGGNLAMLLAVPFLLIGLTVVHVMCRNVTAGRMLLILFYVLMLILGWPLLIVAVLGFVEQFAGLRRRFAAAGPDEEV